MGTDREYTFARSGRRMRPEELSSEVLKSLRSDVEQRTGEVIEAAVITVPAAFELPQCEATRKAAELAGLMFSPLLQEPVAAALAYGFQTDSDRVFWLVPQQLSIEVLNEDGPAGPANSDHFGGGVFFVVEVFE